MTTEDNRRERLRVSLVATLLNEYGSLPQWLRGLRNQTRLPDECIIVDGGSTDGTLELLQAADLPFPTTILVRPGVNISAGRNAAIRKASGDIIAVTDAGTEARPDWLARLVEPLESCPAVDIAAGFFEAEAGTFWEQTLVATTLPDAAEVDPDRFLPSSRSVAFRRAWIEYGFGYPEWLDYCEDVVLDLQLRRAGARQVFVPEARVRFAPRRGPVAFSRQYFRYARGDGKAGLFARRHAIRYVTYSGLLAVLARRRPHEIAVAGVLGAIYITPNVRRYRRWNGAASPGIGCWLGVVGMIGFQRLIGDVAKMIGYPVGLVWRARRDRSLKLWKTTWVNRLDSGDLPRF